MVNLSATGKVTRTAVVLVLVLIKDDLFIKRMLVLVLVLVLIKDHPTIKRMLTTRHPYTRDRFLHHSLKKWHRKPHAAFASSLTSTQVWSQPV